MINRKILKAKTVGSRQNSNLRPIIADFLPQGVNIVVHEYNETECWAICDIWGSNHPLIEHMTTKQDLTDLAKHGSVIEVLPSHPKSPVKLATLSGVVGVNFQIEDEQKKLVIHKGKSGSYIRKQKDPRAGGDVVILDEG